MPKTTTILQQSKTIILLIILLTTSTHLIKSQSFEPPVAEKKDSLCVLHGDSLHDYYKWMENKNNNRLINYLYAENAYANRVMKSSWLLRKQLYEEQKSFIREEYTTDSTLYKSYWYYSKYEKGKDYPVFFRRKDSTQEINIYFDGNKLAEKYSYFGLSTFSISPGQKYLAYGINNDGTDKGYLFIKNIDADTMLKEEIPNVSEFLWVTDSVFYYIVEDKKTHIADRLYRHTLGDSIKNDSIIWYEKDKNHFISIGETGSEKYILIERTGMQESEIYYADISNSPYAKFSLFQKMINGKKYTVNHYKNDSLFYITTNIGNKNGKLMYCPENKTGIENWTDLINLPDSFDYEHCLIYKNHLVYKYNHYGLGYVVVRERNTGNEKIIKGEDDNYLISLSKYFGYDSLKFQYRYGTMVKPFVTHEYNLMTGADTIIKTDTTITPYNPEDYETKRLWATGDDGVRIPIDIVYKKGLKTDGSNPLMLEGYAAYGINLQPAFNETHLLYLRRGFIYAIAHPRGESFLGDKWYKDGYMMKKKNTFKDFIKCAELLIDSGYTSPQNLVIKGGSAGGMLMGAVVNMRPDLFKCVVLNVPFVDVLNEMQDTAWPNIVYHFKEVGNPFIKEQYDYIKSYCPYQNIKDTAYPDMLVTSGFNDSRVPVWSPAKWVAKMRFHKTDTNLLLFNTNMAAGHGGQAGRYKYIEENAFELAFIMKSLGIKEEYITISGKVVDKNDEKLPFVNIYVKGTSHGTTSNYDGEFSLDLRAEKADTIVFQYVGFKKKEMTVDMRSEVKNLIIKLETEDQLLPQVIITADGKDPAYSIIKKVQNNRKRLLKIPEEFSVDIYIKSTSRLNEVPKKIPAFMKNWELPDSNDLGLLSLSESVSKYYYRAPDDYKEKMIASKVAGYSQGYSWNRSDDVMMNFYKNNIPLGWFGERGFVSPLASSAIMYYKYKLVNTKMDNGKTIFKIQVIPRRKHDPVFKGYLYIVSDLWCLNGVDLVLTKDANLKMIDSLVIRQNFIPINDSIWLPFTIQYIQYMKMFGFGGFDNAVGTFTNYNINPHFDNKFFGNEVFRIEDEANKKDTVYWDKSRYIKLSEEEGNYYEKADSLQRIKSDPEYLDSLRRARNKYKWHKGIFTNYNYYDYKNSCVYHIDGLINSIRFNTVEGLVAGIAGGISIYNKKKITDKTNLWFWGGENTIYGKMNYSFTNNKAYGYLYYRKKHFSISGGRTMVNYSNIDNFLNSLYTLLAKENYAKFYQKDFAKINVYYGSFIKGMSMNSSLEYQRRYPLQNNSTFSFYDYFKKLPEKEFLSNNPQNTGDDSPAFKQHDILLFTANFTIKFKQKYGIYPKWGKLYYGSKYPYLYLNYKHGFYLSDSRKGFDFISAAVSDIINMNLFGKSVYTINAGGFLSGRDKMEFIDYEHFEGNQTIILKQSWGKQSWVPFNTLNYFDYSTNDYYISGRIEHHFNGWIFNKLPLIRKIKFQILAGTSVLYSGDNGLFSEFFIGAENIFNALRFDLVTNYQNGKINPLIRIGVDIPF